MYERERSSCISDRYEEREREISSVSEINVKRERDRFQVYER